MDIYEEALRALKRDKRSPGKLEPELKVPAETIRDIKTGKAKIGNLRFRTLRKVRAWHEREAA